MKRLIPILAVLALCAVSAPVASAHNIPPRLTVKHARSMSYSLLRWSMDNYVRQQTHVTKVPTVGTVKTLGCASKGRLVVDCRFALEAHQKTGRVLFSGTGLMRCERMPHRRHQFIDSCGTISTVTTEMTR